MRDNVEARQQVHGAKHVSYRGALLEGHLVMSLVAAQSHQHSEEVLHHAYDGGAPGSAQAEIA